MRFLYITAIPVVALAAVWGYYFSIPVPPDMAEPWLYRLFIGSNALLYKGAYVYSRFTGDDPLAVHAHLQMWMANAAKLPVPNELQEILHVINGVNVRILQASSSGDVDRPALIFYHGGGFYTGTVYMYDALIQRYIQDTGCIAFLIDYRLSWENPAPGPVNECQIATEGIYKDAQKWKFNPKKVILAGDSAGANLAAAVSLRLRDAESSLKPAAQVLLYPWLQALDMHLPAYQQNNHYFISRKGLAMATVVFANVSKEFVARMNDNTHVSPTAFEKLGDFVSPSFLPKGLVDSTYTPYRPGGRVGSISSQLEECVTNPYNFPLMHDDLSDLPPAFILTEQFDVLRDDGVIYAKRLESSGGKVKLIIDRKGFHGMFNLMAYPLNSSHAYAMTEKVTEFIKTVI